MGDVIKLTRATGKLPHARFTREGKAELTYDHGKTWVPAPSGEIALNPLPMNPNS